jgi:tetratricopeptide (TPR) repeat protein
MRTPRTFLQAGLTLVLVLTSVSLGWAAPVPDNDKALSERALKLNEVTGNGPMLGVMADLASDPEGTKKLLKVATGMAKAKDQPFNINAAYVLAGAAQEIGEVDASETFYRVYLKQAKELQSAWKLAVGYMGLMEMFYENRMYAESEKVCKEVLELTEPRDELGRTDQMVLRLKIVTHRHLVRTMARAGKAEDALKLVTNLLKVDPSDYEMHLLKGWVEREAGQYEEAVKTFEAVLTQCAKDKELEKEEKAEVTRKARYPLSSIYVDLKQVDKAAEHLKALLAEEPDNPTYNNDLGYIWADHDMNLDESERLIRKALEEDRKQQKEANPSLKDDEIKDNPAFLDSLGWVLFKQKKYKEAKTHLLEAVKDKDGQHLEIFDHLGDVHMALGEKDAAVAAWKKAVETALPGKRDQEKKVEIEKKIKAQQP